MPSPFENLLAESINHYINEHGYRMLHVGTETSRDDEMRPVTAGVLRFFRKEVLILFLPPLVANPVYAKRLVIVVDPKETKRLSFHVQ